MLREMLHKFWMWYDDVKTEFGWLRMQKEKLGKHLAEPRWCDIKHKLQMNFPRKR